MIEDKNQEIEKKVDKENTEQTSSDQTEKESDVKSEEKVEKDEVPTSSVTISWRPSQPEKVFIAGTFNDWNPESHPLTLGENGEWSIEIELPQGTYEYRLVVDDQWICDPNCEETIPNPFGSENSLLTVK